MPRVLTSDLTLDHLKKEAKRWLKAIRANDATARTRFVAVVGDTFPSPTLRDVQLAIAREFALDGWVTLKRTIERHAPSTGVPADSLTAAISRFLDNACPDHHVRGGSDHIRAENTAMRLLERHPEIATANFYTAVVCGDVDAVTHTLAIEPDWATRPNGEAGPGRTGAGGEGDLVKRDWGSKGWEPLSYLCFTRLPLPSVADNAAAIARVLLDHGADPNVSFVAGGSSYTPLVGAIGAGKRAGPLIRRGTRSSGFFSNEAPTRTIRRSFTTSTSTEARSGFSRRFTSTRCGSAWRQTGRIRNG